MDIKDLKKILRDIEKGKITVEKAAEKIKYFSIENLEFARIDHHRNLRKGFPEVIFCEGKTVSQIKDIAKSILSRNHTLLATRATIEAYKAVKKIDKKAVYNEQARTIVVEKKKPKSTKGVVMIVTAGTSDIPVAEEAYMTCKTLGSTTDRLYDVGVAGIHRVLSQSEKLGKARVIIVVAGMEGALASVVAGLVDKPVIAVPTSVGYGASFGGIAALLTMLNSCASGIATVNIDNGFGAGYLAHNINILGE
ncbi:MAG: nickel pincer cofactor biosynthesis protein LarB [Candidatus Schekmanbacteria bacterium]|nr:MAG: nickel pincer cofactor biosynthesis protein LarB [Candidatus Schekmanbacteria bacterium]